MSDEKQNDWKQAWGEHSRVKLPKLGYDFSVSIRHDFFYSVVQSALEKQGLRDNKKDMQAFMDAALEKWFEKHKGKPEAMSPAEKQSLITMVPSAARGDKSRILKASLEGKTREDSISRVLDSRFSATKEGKSLALREALQDHLKDILQV